MEKILQVVKPQFQIGKVYISDAVLNDIPSLDLAQAMQRHVGKDWGKVGCRVRKANELATKERGKVLSKHACQGRPFYILTDTSHISTVIVVEEDVWDY